MPIHVGGNAEEKEEERGKHNAIDQMDRGSVTVHFNWTFKMYSPTWLQQRPSDYTL